MTVVDRSHTAYPSACGRCGGELAPSCDPLEFEVEGTLVEVPGLEHGVCTRCGEEYLSLEVAGRLQREAARLADRECIRSERERGSS